MTNVTMLVHNRPRLTRQAIESLLKNTEPTIQIAVYDDQSDDATSDLLSEIIPNGERSNTKVLTNKHSRGTGEARNSVIEYAQERSRGDYLYLSDNDVYFQPLWLYTLIEAYEWARETHGVIALGAYAHPYLKPRQSWPFFSSVLGRTIQIGELDALPTQSWLWRWEDFDKLGPFCATPPGKVCQSEDVDMSNRIKAAGGKVAAIYPPLICNCGVVNSFGEKIPGYDEVCKEYLPPGVCRE